VTVDDRQAAVEARDRRRQLHLAIEQAANRSGTEKNGRGSGVDVWPFGF